MGRRLLLNMVDGSAPRDQARLWEQQEGLGTAFMAVVPHDALHTTISSDTYRLGLKWWLGLPLIQPTPGKPFVCPGCATPLDTFGDHLVCCRRTNFARRHCGVQGVAKFRRTQSSQGFIPRGQTSPQELRRGDKLRYEPLATHKHSMELSKNSRLKRNYDGT